jgi:uncharacterized protein (TIGR02453 family)
MSTHFSPAALKFLRGLARHNDREWFEPRKPLYEHELKAPLLALIAEINAAFEDFAPQYVRPPQKAMMRLYRDVRFSPDKSPYKTSIAAWWSRQGLEKTSGGGFYLHLKADQLLIAAGVYMPEKEQLRAIRRMLEERHADFRALLAANPMRTLFEPFDGLKLTRAPKGFSPDSPALDLILQRQFGVHATLPAETALSPGLLGEILKRFKLATPLVDLLNEPLVPTARKPLF